MDTPICDFVENYVKSNAARVHMPGHKGRSLPECGFGSAFGYDITEIQGADALFEAEGIIRQSEENAKRLFGTAETVYSAGPPFAYKQCFRRPAAEGKPLSAQGTPTVR